MRNGKRIADCFGKRIENAFSLIELLVVIGIIALLASLIFPAISMVKENARKTQAKAMAENLVMAIKQYETTYGLLPVKNSSSDTIIGGEKSSTASDDYDELIACLTQVDGPKKTVNDAISDGLNNQRKTRFLEVPADYSTKGYVDPWGYRFRIGIDGNYNKKVENFPKSGTNLNGTVFVYSLGPDKTNNNGDSIKDVISWK